MAEGEILGSRRNRGRKRWGGRETAAAGESRDPSTARPTTTHQDVAFRVTVLAAVAGITAVLALPFLTGRQNFLHDSWAHATLLGLFYDRLYSGDSWLWSTALNGGHPIWTSLEVSSIHDPVAFLVFSAAAALRTGWFVPYHLTAFTWLFIFAAGGALCAHFLTGNRWAALLTFILLCAGPVALAVPGLSSGFLVPFRYFPLAIYFYFRLRVNVTLRDAFFFNATVAFGLAGYQSVYTFLLFLTLVATEFLVGARGYLRWMKQFLFARYLCLMFIPTLALAPSLAWLDYTEWLAAIPHEYLREQIHFLEASAFIRELLLPYAHLLEVSRSVWDGSGFLGLLVLPFLLLGLRRNIKNLLVSPPTRGTEALKAHLSGLLAPWFVLTTSLTFGALGLRAYVESNQTLLGIRNFGFLLTGAIFILALVAAAGLAEAMSRRYRLADLGTDLVLFSSLTLLSYWWFLRPETELQDVLTLVGLFGLVAGVWWFLGSRQSGLALAVPVVLAVLAELLWFDGHFLPAFERLAMPANREAVHALIQSRTRSYRAGDEELPDSRLLEFPVEEYWPMHLEGPAVVRIPSAMSEPLYTGHGTRGLQETHLFRLRAYHALITGSVDAADMREVLGVSRPILELVPRDALDEAAEGYRLVLWQGREPAAPPPAGQVLEVDYAGDRVTVALEAEGEAVLVYRDNAAPGWSVTVDGEDSALLVVDRVNKAVAVPPGKHEVEFLYRPWAYLVTFALRAVVLIASVLACIAMVFRPQRARHPS
jgi:hypothetical protein